MISKNCSFSKPVKAALIVISLFLLHISVPTTDTCCFSCVSDETGLKKPLAIYKSFVTLMASARTELEQYQHTAETVIRQTEEAVKTWKIVKVETQKVTASKGYVWPLKGAITSKFGRRVHPITGCSSFHNGIDIRGKAGTSVLCPTDGIVVDTGWAGALGRMVKVKTSTGHVLCFGHLSKIKCKPGEKLNRGQVLGTVGSTGRATGPHLHFTVFYRGDYMNPVKYLSK